MFLGPQKTLKLWFLNRTSNPFLTVFKQFMTDSLLGVFYSAVTKKLILQLDEKLELQYMKDLSGNGKICIDEV